MIVAARISWDTVEAKVLKDSSQGDSASLDSLETAWACMDQGPRGPEVHSQGSKAMMLITDLFMYDFNLVHEFICKYVQWVFLRAANPCT